MSRLSFTYAQERCVRLAGKLMQSTNMIYPGARIGVAVSGGVDSWVLLQTLKIRQRIVPFPFEIIALHLNPGFVPENHTPLEVWAKNNHVPVYIEATEHGPRAHTEENRTKSPCFYCALLRRKRLFQICQEQNLSHLAFGHNADDLVSTFFLNMFQGGRVQGMSPREPFFQGKLMVIRPLLLVEKKLISKAAATWELPVWDSCCPSADTTKRAEVLADLHHICQGQKGRKKNILNALTRWQHQLSMEQQQKSIQEETRPLTAQQDKKEDGPLAYEHSETC